MNINFKGIINGKSYDNLESFMKDLEDLKEDQDYKNISFSYQTTFDEEGKKEMRKIKRGVNRADVILSFDPDQITGGEEDEKIFNDLYQSADSKYTCFKQKNHSQEDLTNYLNIVEENKNYWDEVEKENKTLRSKLSDRRQDLMTEVNSLDKKIKICDNVDRSIRPIKNFNAAIYEYIHKRLTKLRFLI